MQEFHPQGYKGLKILPALVFGKYDPTDRLYYWLYQVKKKNVLFLPENGERKFSTTYVYDLVETIIQSLTSDFKSEAYNVITNPNTSIKQIINHANLSFNNTHSFINGSVDFLTQNGINQWTDMPLWINGDHLTYSNQKLKEDLDINLTPFKDAIDETVEYYDSLNWLEPKYGMSENRRQELIKKIQTQ